MGLLDKYDINGIGMTPRPAGKHQLCILKIAAGLHIKFKNDYLILPEGCIDLSNLNSKVPDIVVYDKATEKSLMFIEITTTKEKNKIIKKAKLLMNQYKILESFIYDYELNEWLKLTAVNNFSNEKYYSDILNYSLKEALIYT
jgi:hypothetical protein